LTSPDPCEKFKKACELYLPGVRANTGTGGAAPPAAGTAAGIGD